MSLKFLGTKSWHPSNLKNVEQVWLAEEEAKKQMARDVAFARQVEQEREAELLRLKAFAATLPPRPAVPTPECGALKRAEAQALKEKRLREKKARAAALEKQRAAAVAQVAPLAAPPTAEQLEKELKEAKKRPAKGRTANKLRKRRKKEMSGTQTPPTNVSEQCETGRAEAAHPDCTEAVKSGANSLDCAEVSQPGDGEPEGVETEQAAASEPEQASAQPDSVKTQCDEVDSPAPRILNEKSPA
mmetsp:Transcript_25702/g.59275  ORF Transcript_25702/g.59275 Transcript_25702/m.59275 type:complete len:244 (+) Transcript_25702:35-766(+)